MDISRQMAEAALLDDHEIEQEEIEANTVWPLQTKFYCHSSKESNYEQGEELGLKGEALDNWRYTGYEVAFDIEISEDGSTVATHVNGVALVTPVKI